MFNKCYFKGWYYKCCTGNKTIAFIPAYHQSNNIKNASLQIITDDAVFNTPFKSLEFKEKPLCARIGNSFFSEKGIEIDLKTDKLTAVGALRFSYLSPIKYNIMGPFRLVPLQCNHSVYSMRHRIDGQITVNGQQFDFQNGIGYIEGDCGRSFPNRYIWTQCFFKSGSLMLSVADIPFLGARFTGIIGVVMLDGKEYRIGTYLGAKVKLINKNTISVIQGGYELTAQLIRKNALPLCAPESGCMTRTIHESASCKAYYRFLHKGKLLCEFTSNRASFEFEYI